MLLSPLRAHNLREAGIVFFADMGAVLGGIVLYLFLGNNCESSSSCNTMGFVILPLLLVAVPIITLMIFGHALSIAGSPIRQVFFQNHRRILLLVAAIGVVLTLGTAGIGAIIGHDIFIAPEVIPVTRNLGGPISRPRNNRLERSLRDTIATASGELDIKVWTTDASAASELLRETQQYRSRPVENVDIFIELTLPADQVAIFCEKEAIVECFLSRGDQ